MHPLEGPRGKIDRAKSQIKTLETELRSFREQYTYRVVVAEFDSDTGYYPLCVSTNAPQDFDVAWSVTVGEIAYNLRSALDQLVCRLAILKNRRCDCRDTSFPILLRGTRRDSRKHDDWYWSVRTRKKPRARAIPRGVRLLERKHIADIKRLQPYHRQNGNRLSPLWLLDELNNADKHRKIQIVAFQTRSLSTPPWGRWFNGIALGGLKVDFSHRLIDGTKVGRIRKDIQDEMQMNFSLEPEIVFWDGCNAVKRLEVIPTLQRIANAVDRIVESFGGEF